ncbi:MAG: hypothetical protein WC508_03550 [Patescibacteria group bacterium]
MSFRVFLLLVIAGTILAWLAWGMVIFYFDPSQAGIAGFTIFYLTLFLGLSGLLFLIINSIKTKIGKDQLLLYRIRISLRHAIMFSVIVLGWALLKTQGLLRWWNFLLLVLVLALLEFFFISTQKQRNTYPGSDPAI